MPMPFYREIDLKGNKILELGSPISRTDAATKGYVDDRVGEIDIPTISSYSSDLGDSMNVVYNIDHNLGTRDVHVALFDNITDEEVDTDVEHVSENRVQLIFGAAPDVNEFRVLIVRVTQ